MEEESDTELDTIDVEDTSDPLFDGEEPPNDDNKPIIDNDKRISKKKMTMYEFVRVIGERIKQLTNGAKSLIVQSPLSEKFSYSEIAIEEFKHNMIPFKIRRPLKDHYEIWSLSELDKTHLAHLL
jgi:DNA-directed RNA polymerase subunit K/omega